MLVPNRHGSSDSFRYGFNGKEPQHIREGVIAMILGRGCLTNGERWFAPDAMEKKYPRFLLIISSLNNPIPTGARL
jgi:hypothetical protein